MMRHNIYKVFFLSLLMWGSLSLFTSCDNFLYDDSEQVIYDEEHRLQSDADTLWTMAGIMSKMQALADRTILLGELRGDLVELTENASADLQEIASFAVSDKNAYNRPSDYYAVINNCNFYLARADTSLRDNRNEYIFMKEYAAVKAFRAWTYLQLALNYGRVPFITTPILSMADAQQQFPQYGIQEICEYFISDIAPYADVPVPGYGSIRNTDSKLFYIPVYLLLGDLNLWAGHYKAAAENYYRFLATRNGTNSAYPTTTSSVRFSPDDSHWRETADSWSLSFMLEGATANAEVITIIPCDSIPSEGNYSRLRDIFNTTGNNEYKASLVPSQAIVDLSSSQKYCHFTKGGDFVFSPSGLSGNLTGDLRLFASYRTLSSSQMYIDGKKIENYAEFSKYQTRNVRLYRRTLVYLRLAEALNRAGYPRFAFQILKQGINNSVIENEVIPYYEADAAWLRTFDFPNINYVLETTAGGNSENTMGIHSRGCGYTAYDETYALPDDSTLTDSLQRLDYQIEQVENLIIDEEALEFAFEGYRFYDLMRVALRRQDPSFLANRVYARKGVGQGSDLSVNLRDTHTWYLNWNGRFESSSATSSK